MSMIFSFLILIVPVLIAVAFITLLERKLLSLVGSRLGPNKVSVGGALQPIGDAVKLSNKQSNTLSNFSFFFYYLSAILMILMSLTLWLCSCVEPTPVSLKHTILIIMVVLGFNSLNSIISGWSTFSKYSLMGSLRTVAQLISYESVLYLCLFFILISYTSFNWYNTSFYPLYFFSLVLPFCFYIWIPSYLAELNRTPYDFSEGESELVSGFNTEFGSGSFTLIFLAEYSNIIFLCLLSAILFMKGLSMVFFLIMVLYTIWVRSVLPRYRFDKLMVLAWKFFIPFLTLMLFSITLL